MSHYFGQKHQFLFQLLVTFTFIELVVDNFYRNNAMTHLLIKRNVPAKCTKTQAFRLVLYPYSFYFMFTQFTASNDWNGDCSSSGGQQ